MSRPARDAWVEIGSPAVETRSFGSRPARDAWVEMRGAPYTVGRSVVASRKGRVGRNTAADVQADVLHGRVPQGTRGLKWRKVFVALNNLHASRPARDAWVEIPCGSVAKAPFLSRPARDTWVEMLATSRCIVPALVASRKGRDDHVQAEDEAAAMDQITKMYTRKPAG